MMGHTYQFVPTKGEEFFNHKQNNLTKSSPLYDITVKRENAYTRYKAFLTPAFLCNDNQQKNSNA